MLFSLLYDSYLVCILFGMPSLLLYTVIICVELYIIVCVVNNTCTATSYLRCTAHRHAQHTIGVLRVPHVHQAELCARCFKVACGLMVRTSCYSQDKDQGQGLGQGVGISFFFPFLLMVRTSCYSQDQDQGQGQGLGQGVGISFFFSFSSSIVTAPQVESYESRYAHKTRISLLGNRTHINPLST